MLFGSPGRFAEPLPPQKNQFEQATALASLRTLAQLTPLTSDQLEGDSNRRRLAAAQSRPSRMCRVVAPEGVDVGDFGRDNLGVHWWRAGAMWVVAAALTVAVGLTVQAAMAASMGISGTWPTHLSAGSREHPDVCVPDGEVHRRRALARGGVPRTNAGGARRGERRLDVQDHVSPGHRLVGVAHLRAVKQACDRRRKQRWPA